jgi:type VI secretion system secreted protein VgrG
MTYQATSSVSGIRAGARFDLNGHPVLPLNAPYVVVAATHHVGTHASRVGGAGQGHYLNRFTAVAADVPYRPRRAHPRPRIHGLQTAIVTGPAGEEIHTDEHGRVKVQFHWDRDGQADEKTTCWIRCMQTWSGHGFGAFVLPRVGMEVVVSFIDGDVDRPLVTGCVYNGDNPSPYPLPEKKMVSTFKTQSYPGGDGYNELRFDDTKGDEEIWLHGEKDWNTVIENDLNRDVLRDESQNVSRNRTRTVGNDERITVGGDRTERVRGSESLAVDGSRSHSIGGSETITVAAAQKVAVLADQSTKVGAHRSVRVGLTHVITAGVSLELRCGSSRILMESSGKITIEGTEIHTNSSGDTRMTAGHIYLN